MKYSVGQKVRVRKDLKVGKYYGEDYNFNDEMGLYKGKELTITKICKYSPDDYYYETKENCWSWIDRMLEPVEDIIEYKGKKYDVVKQPIIVGIETVKQESLEGFDKLIFLKEHKEEILDEAEKRYLRNVIKPFKKDVTKIYKMDSIYVYGYEFIKIITKKDGDVLLPRFKKNSMYKGMKLDKGYTLEQLGLGDK